MRVCACAYVPSCVCVCVCGILNKQLSISVNRARGMPEAQVAQLQADSSTYRQKHGPLSSVIQTGLWERRR